MAGRRIAKGMLSSFRPGDCHVSKRKKPRRTPVPRMDVSPSLMPPPSDRPNVTEDRSELPTPKKIHNQLRPPSIAKINSPNNTNMIGLNTINTTAAGLIKPMTKFVAQRFANFSHRLTSVCPRASKSCSEGVPASRYQPVESLDILRRCFGRRAGLDVGVLGGVGGVVFVIFVSVREDNVKGKEDNKLSVCEDNMLLG
jgi:hypothetical protein